MAITTLDGVIAGGQPPQFFYRGLTGTLVSGRPHSLFYQNAGAAGSSIPGAAVAPTPGIAGAALTTYSGQLPFPSISSGNRYLSRFWGVASGVGGVLQLCDRLWHNSGIVVSVATSQTVGSVTWPARDANGATSGEGVQLALEVTTGLGAGTPTYNVTYTNSGGTGTRSGVNIVATAASAIQGAFYPIGMQAGDTGVRSVDVFTNTGSSASGAVSLVAYRVLASVDLPNAGSPGVVNFITGQGPIMYANSVPFLVLIPNGTTSSRVMGQVVYADG